ncbi:4-hydroxybenzoate polyprenyltransferase-like prenyltransferase [Bernardetia litoralis DSM 6794]|uniref:4-hydroxybenzoate polyprenyltransferase-like prenyltransferase n=1 Tax=Bernardetia litoralis (strain ATCC 23117 / DSM 6794 / NBRC 15988 / NCIMB 1366 / Fx l1 / Sio-4) TaxID=880071 RepID=I4ANY5_BERLS|nr:geranylgeranylglycerol-phosphate geranylgeranyltransferase [Bernardetia litoralis]AFM05670.1 4-hydroxybenzoate polyprenyltransferase-like prenyltransferase [Bernardetia litoralis DSM 6794]
MKSLFSLLVHFSISLVSSLRPLNLFIIILTQTLTSVFLLDNPLCISKLFKIIIKNNCTDFYFFVLATVLSAAAGYILNNIFDRKIDLINSPKRGLFTEKNLSFLCFLSILFFGIALFLSFLISLQIGIYVFLSIALLIFYAKYSKKIGILKPILVSFLTSFSIILVGFLASFDSSILYCFAIWAFLLSMLREFIKDFEDLEGDSSQNSFTSVIHLGKRNSILFLNFLSILLILSILISVFISTNTILNSVHKMVMIILVGIFLFLLNNKQFHSSNKPYKKLSLFCKIMMLVGILGMMVY